MTKPHGCWMLTTPLISPWRILIVRTITFFAFSQSPGWIIMLPMKWLVACGSWGTVACSSLVFRHPFVISTQIWVPLILNDIFLYLGIFKYIPIFRHPNVINSYIFPVVAQLRIELLLQPPIPWSRVIRISTYRGAPLVFCWCHAPTVRWFLMMCASKHGGEFDHPSYNGNPYGYIYINP